MQTLSTALDKARDFVGATLDKVEVLTKPQRKFLLWLFERWLMLPVRYNFLNLSRYGGYSEKAIRTQLSRKLPFVDLFHELFEGLQKKECIAVFDPAFLGKSGEKTYGLAKYWSGTVQQAKKGLEAGCLAIVDVEDRTAYSLEVVQMPVPGEEGGLVCLRNPPPMAVVMSLGLSRMVTFAECPSTRNRPTLFTSATITLCGCRSIVSAY